MAARDEGERSVDPGKGEVDRPGDPRTAKDEARITQPRTGRGDLPAQEAGQEFPAHDPIRVVPGHVGKVGLRAGHPGVSRLHLGAGLGTMSGGGEVCGIRAICDAFVVVRSASMPSAHGGSACPQHSRADVAVDGAQAEGEPHGGSFGKSVQQSAHCRVYEDHGRCHRRAPMCLTPAFTPASQPSCMSVPTIIEIGSIGLLAFATRGGD